MASVSTSIPSITWDDSTGPTVPTDQEILDGAMADMTTAFGSSLNITSYDTPQGQIASSETAIVSDKNAQILEMTNQCDPQYASGRWQDAIARIYYLTRKAATSTTVTATVTGTSGTVLPKGTLAQDTSGYTYASTGEATIDDTGTASVEFSNTETGAIACAAGTLTVVYQTIVGWDAITNAAAGTLGSAEESRAEFEYRRKNSVAANGTGTVAAVTAAVAAVDDVTDFYVIDNNTASAVTSGSTDYSIAAHSIYVAVVGGDDDDIAAAIFNKLNAGCAMNGNTSVTVTDSDNYSTPYPSYTIKFNRPTAVPIYFAVTIQANTLMPSDISDQIKSAIIARFNGTDGSTKQRIGADIIAGKYYAPIADLSDYVAVLTLYIGTAASPTSTLVEIGIDQYPTIDESNITVTVSS